MKYIPQDTRLRKHIDHYWIVRDSQQLFKQSPPIYGYPGITPEILIVLEGSFDYTYEEATNRVSNNQLFSFIHREVLLDMANLISFIIVQFKPHALASLLPFISQKPNDLMAAPVQEGSVIFGMKFHQLLEHIRNAIPEVIVDELDTFFYQRFQATREGFITELSEELKGVPSLKSIMNTTRYSYSTLERYFKKDTGLTPKQYQSLQRYKAAVQEIYGTRNDDWMHYVEKYGYFDQSHFIKNIKRFTTFTPAQLLTIPGLISFRPENL